MNANDVFKLYLVEITLEITENQIPLLSELGESGIGNTYVMDDDADLGVTSLRKRDSQILTIDMQPQY
jgi:hypothetical protein